MEVACQLRQSCRFSNISISDWFEMFLVSSSIIVISKVNHTWIIFPWSYRSFPTKPVFERILTRAFCRYILNLMPNFPWHCWTEFNQSWKDLRKTLQSHEILQSLIDLSGANIGRHSLKIKRLVNLNVYDVKNQSINEQERAVLERCVNSVFYLHIK